jgi:hypothetical protein
MLDRVCNEIRSSKIGLNLSAIDRDYLHDQRLLTGWRHVAASQMVR